MPIMEGLCLDLVIVGLVNSTVDLIVRGQGRAQVVQIEAGDARLRPFSCWADRHHRRVDNNDHGTRSVQRDRTDAYTCSRLRKRTLKRLV